MAKRLGSVADPLWYKDAVIYELHVRAFKDSNADGIGDFPGLIQKMDYLQDLGVTCLWVLPFFPSPLRDDGYDISDYLNVHPMYGTIDNFHTFLDAAHDRGLQVMIELVVNHTSDQHPWFQAARRAPRGSPERDFYVWSDTEERYKDARIIFSDTERSNWTWDPLAEQYYWHRFSRASAGSEPRKPRSGRGSPESHALLVGHGSRRTSPRRNFLLDRARRKHLRELAGDACRDQKDPVRD